MTLCIALGDFAQPGVEFTFPEDDGDARHIPSEGLRVYQTGGVIESSAFDWGGGTACKIYLVITSGIARARGLSFSNSCSHGRRREALFNGSKIPS